MALEPLGIQALAAGVPDFVRDLGRMDKSIAGVGQRAGQLGKDFVGLGQNVLKFGAIAGTAIVGAAAAAGTALAKLAIDAAPLQSVATAFDEITSSIGQGSSEMLADLRRASFGIVTTRDLMESFNTAAALIGTQFAQRLPEAFELLGKVSLATGQDMGFLLNSLVKGVGRLSPLILDNLGVQVDLVSANEAYAKSLGKSASELTKNEQQLAIYNQVIEKLQESTSALGDPADSAVVAFRRFGVIMQDIRDQIGLTLLPAFANFARRLEPLIQNMLPLLVELFRDRVAPAVDRVLSFIGNLLEVLADAGPFSIEFREALLAMVPQEVQDRIFGFAEQVRSWFTQVRDFIVENKDAIISAIQGIGTALAAAAIVATIAQIVGILGRLTSPIGLLLTLVGLLKAAWDTNFMGMRDTLTEFWETTGRPIFDRVVAFLQENIPKAVQFVSDLFSGQLGPAVGGLAGQFQPLLEAVGNLVRVFVDDFPLIAEQGQGIVAFLAETLGPTFSSVLTSIVNIVNRFADAWEKGGDDVIRFVGTMVKIVLATLENFLVLVTGLADIWTALWTGDFAGAVDAARRLIETFVGNALAVVGTTIDDMIGIFQGIGENLATILRVGLGSLIDNVIVPWGQDIFDAINDVAKGIVGTLAAALGISSPSKIMMSIGNQMMEGLAAGIRGATPLPAVALQAAAAQVVGAGPTSETNLNLTIHSASRAEPIAADFQMMQSMAEKV